MVMSSVLGTPSSKIPFVCERKSEFVLLARVRTDIKESELYTFRKPTIMDKGVIYMLTCKPSGKKYIGQAVNFTGKNNRPWGMEGRWKSHVKEALEGGKDHCRLLNNAIRKHGVDAFERVVLCECKIDELDAMEEKFMNDHNIFEPELGLNLKRGGSRGKWSEETKKLKSEAMKGTTHTDEARQKMSINQIGNRRDAKERKHPEDAGLPKYINAKRIKDKVVGYAISGFPVGIDKKEYISKSFYDRNNPQKAYETAVSYLNDLKAEYDARIQAAVEERRREAERVAIVEQTMSRSIDEYITPIPHPENPNKIKGYMVSGMKDPHGNPIPEKRFDDVTVQHAITRAQKYVKQIQMLLENNATVEDWSKIDTIYKCDKKGVDKEVLPKYINVCNYKGEKSGYVVNGYPLPEGKKSCKKFTNTHRFTIEQLYDMAIQYLEDLKKQYPIA